MPPWLVPFASLIGVVVGFVLGTGRDVVKDHKDKRKRTARVRRLLAHHATTLAEDARVFLTTARRCFGLPEPEIAARFADVMTSDHVYREQIADRLDDLSDELITLFRDLDIAASGAANAVTTLQRWASTFFRVREITLTQSVSGIHRTMPMTLAEELERATLRHRELLDAALATLRRLAKERTALPAQSQSLLEAGTSAPALPPGENTK